MVRTDESFFTAVNNAKNSGIITDESQVITSEQIKSMDRGLYIAKCPEYKVFKDVSDAEWLDVLRLRREDGKAVAVTAERLEDLGLMNEADASFVVAGPVFVGVGVHTVNFDYVDLNASVGVFF